MYYLEESGKDLQAHQRAARDFADNVEHHQHFADRVERIASQLTSLIYEVEEVMG